jgi:hypothetical protein
MKLPLAARAFVFCLPLASIQAADDDKPELLPPPRRVEPASSPVIVLEPPPPPAYYRKNRYDVWQAYEVDRTGRFRPRVIYGPSGAYYYETGKPYPWTTTQPLNWKPVILGSP